MKICIIFPKDSEAIFDITSSRTFGGATIQMFTIASELSKNKEYNVSCLIPRIKNKELLKNSPLKLIEVFNIKKTILGTVFLVRKQIKKDNPDIIIQHGLTFFSCLLSLYCKISKIKFVFMFASDVEVKGKYQSSEKECLLFNILLKTATTLIVQNKLQQDYLSTTKGYKSSLFYMGFSIQNIDKIFDKNILWIGRCDAGKQPELFIDIARQYPSERFVMICPKVDKKYFLRIKTMAEKIENLKFIDFISFEDTWSYFKRAKIFINTSIYEGFPQTFVQAVTCGVPIISLNVNPDNFITDNNCGLVCNGNIDSISREIKLFLNSQNLYNRISNNVYRYAKLNHNISDNVKKLINLVK